MRAMWRAAVATAALGVAGAASAHEFDCKKTVNGGQVFTVESYPATLNYRFEVINTHPTAVSVALKAEDPRLAQHGFSFYPVPPFELPVGGSVVDTFALEVPDYYACLRLAATDGLEDNIFDNVFRVRWELGSDHCSARVICMPPPPPPPDGGTPPPDGGTPPPDGGGGACITRTQGFFGTHPDALAQCLAEGPMELGFVSVSSVDTALAILRGDLNQCGTPGSDERALGRVRIQLGQQLIAALCNTRLFGTEPPAALDDAINAIGGNACVEINSFIDDITGFNEGCDSAEFPSGFNPGPANPQISVDDLPALCSGACSDTDA
jgi:hypothetical protein